MKTVEAAVLASMIGGSLLLSIPSHAAFRGERFGHERLANDIRSDRADIRRDRNDLQNDRRDIREDRQDLRQDLRDGTSRRDIKEDRSDIRKDERDITRDRQDLQQDRRDLDHDLDRRDHSCFGWWRSWWNSR